MSLYDLNDLIIRTEYIPNEIEEEIYFYRFHDPYYHGANEPVEEKYKAYKETPKGYWIIRDFDHHGDYVNPICKKWIRKQYETDRIPKKLFAYRNRPDALYSYYRKKLEHMRHLERKHNQLKHIVRRLEHTEQFFGRERPMITNVNEFLSGNGIRRIIKPLNEKRIKPDFIDEMEMEL